MTRFLSPAILAAMLVFTGLPPAAAAIDCGEPPLAMPAIPDGTRSVREDMLAGVEAVKAYSDRVDAFLACKDERAMTVFQWMNEEQRARWNEDLDDLHQQRVELQRQMNEAIRVFNQSSAVSGSD